MSNQLFKTWSVQDTQIGITLYKCCDYWTCRKWIHKYASQVYQCNLYVICNNGLWHEVREIVREENTIHKHECSDQWCADANEQIRWHNERVQFKETFDELYRTFSVVECDAYEPQDVEKWEEFKLGLDWALLDTLQEAESYGLDCDFVSDLVRAQITREDLLWTIHDIKEEFPEFFQD